MKTIRTDGVKEVKAVEAKLVSQGYRWCAGGTSLFNTDLYKDIYIICYREKEKQISYYIYNCYLGHTANMTAEEFLNSPSAKKHGYFYTGNPNK